jgi:hypothetical protein
VLPLHECTVEPPQDAAEFVADPAAAESDAEPFHFVVDPAAIGAALTETSCLCVRV